jgi:hypothetical protein
MTTTRTGTCATSTRTERLVEISEVKYVIGAERKRYRSSEVGFKVLKAASIKTAVFRFVVPCSLVEVHPAFQKSFLPPSRPCLPHSSCSVICNNINYWNTAYEQIKQNLVGDFFSSGFRRRVDSSVDANVWEKRTIAFSWLQMERVCSSETLESIDESA